MEAAVILGAGFSKNSGIPVLSEIPKLLIDDPGNDAFESAVTAVLIKFMEQIFGFEGSSVYPNLDDMFTCIDISTNSGHHLGIKYSPLHLRAVRRLLVYRVFSILENHFMFSQEVQQFISHLTDKYAVTSFIVLNWDTVLERYLHLVSPVSCLDYCNGGIRWEPGRENETSPKINVLKLHGSSNWLYCDNCRALFYDMENGVTNKKKAGIQSGDFNLFEELSALPINMREELTRSEKCRICYNPVSSHIATFSYRKSFRSNSFSNIWGKAEEVLSNASQWIFVGYSLPDADYEFKHLLKISQLKTYHMRQEKRSIESILLNSEKTTQKYRRFFGEALGTVYNGGIAEYMQKHKISTKY